MIYYNPMCYYTHGMVPPVNMIEKEEGAGPDVCIILRIRAGKILSHSMTLFARCQLSGPKSSRLGGQPPMMFDARKRVAIQRLRISELRRAMLDYSSKEFSRCQAWSEQPRQHSNIVVYPSNTYPRFPFPGLLHQLGCVSGSNE
jgi:hypothetical protein